MVGLLDMMLSIAIGGLAIYLVIRWYKNSCGPKKPPEDGGE